MYFDFLKNVIIPHHDGKVFAEAEKLYDQCIRAEQNAKTHPNVTVLAIRLALESLMKGFLIEVGQYDKRDKKTLAALIDDYVTYCDFIYQKKIHELTQMRQDVSKYFHTDTTNNGETVILLIKDATVQDAVKFIKNLYDILTTIFQIPPDIFDPDMLPIWPYIIEKRIPATEYESVEGNYNFKGKDSSGKIDKYAYIRPFNAKNDNSNKVFSERDSDVQDIMKNKKPSNYIIAGWKIPTDAQIEIGYMAYEIQKDTVTLDRLISPSAISSTQLLNIIYQCSLGLIDLMSGKNIVHHRWIRPSCIFVTPDQDYLAQLGCFETAKIEYEDFSGETVSEQIQDALKTSFVHPLMVNLDNVSMEYWEKGDVYSLAATLLYCIDEKALKRPQEDKNNTTVLRNNYSADFCDKMDKILNSDSNSLDMVPTMKEFSTLLDKELTRASSPEHISEKS